VDFNWSLDDMRFLIVGLFELFDGVVGKEKMREIVDECWKK
jgi:hypothetical protein